MGVTARRNKPAKKQKYAGGEYKLNQAQWIMDFSDIEGPEESEEGDDDDDDDGGDYDDNNDDRMYEDDEFCWSLNVFLVFFIFYLFLVLF